MVLSGMEAEIQLTLTKELDAHALQSGMMW